MDRDMSKRLLPVVVGGISLAIATIMIARFAFPPRPRFGLLADGLIALSCGFYLSVAVAYSKGVSWRDQVVHAANLLLIVNASFGAIHLIKLVAYRFSFTPWETAIYMSATRFPAVSQIYAPHNLDRLPIYVSIYSPAYYYLYRGAVSVVGQTTNAGRWLSVLGIVATVWLLSIAHRRSALRIFQPIPPLLFLSLLPTLCWTGSFAKPEYFAICLSLGGILAYFETDATGKWGWGVATALFCSAALMMKPTILAGTTAILLHLLWGRRFKLLIQIFAPIAAILSCYYAVFSIRTSGGFWTMTVRANAARLIPDKIADYALKVFLRNPIVLLGIASAAILLIYHWRNNDRDRVWPIFCFAALAVFFITAARPGASNNYFLESAMGCSASIGLLLSDLAGRRKNVLLVFMTTVLILGLCLNLRLVARPPNPSYDARNEDSQISSTLAGLSMGTNEYILADPEFTFLSTASGHEVAVNDSLMWSVMVDNQTASDAPLLTALRSQRIPYLVLAHSLDQLGRRAYGSRLWPLEVVDYLKVHYSCNMAFTRKSGTSMYICDRK